MREMAANVKKGLFGKTEETLRKQLTTISWMSLPAYSPTTSLRGLCSAGTYFVKRAPRGSVDGDGSTDRSFINASNGV